MSAETLHRAHIEAARLLEVDLTQLEALQQQEVRHLGSIALRGQEFPAYRAFTGPDDLIGKGGIRFAHYDSPERAIDMVLELSGEMDSKLALRGHHMTFRGAKGLVNISPWDLSSEEKEEVARQFADLLEFNGLLGHTTDVGAGDVGTNGLSDIIANRYAEMHPTDPYGRAVITGKSPENGGLEARAGATGLGGISSLFALMEYRGESKATASLQGFGNVGAWFAHYAATDPQKRVAVTAISEREGVLWTSDPDGLPITMEMVREIGDNSHWTGPKLRALREMILRDNPDMDVHLSLTEDDDAVDILNFKADYFVPAAMSDVITMDTVESLGARKGVIELANGPTTADAHDYMVANGLDVIADIVANSGGVDMSITEWKANIDMADDVIHRMPDTDTANDNLRASSEALTKEVLHMAENLGTRDLRVAAAALSIIRLMERRNAFATALDSAGDKPRASVLKPLVALGAKTGDA